MIKTIHDEYHRANKKYNLLISYFKNNRKESFIKKLKFPLVVLYLKLLKLMLSWNFNN